MKEKIYKMSNLGELPMVVKQFVDDWKSYTHFAFYGDMGVGKTTFIKTLCEVLKVEDFVTSPTFSIVNEYMTENDDIIYHFDFYRIKEEEEVLDMGFYDYIDSGRLCLMEWPEKIGALLPENLCTVSIQEIDGQKRIITVKG